MCLRTATFVSYQPTGEMTPGPVQPLTHSQAEEQRVPEGNWRRSLPWTEQARAPRLGLGGRTTRPPPRSGLKGGSGRA